MSKLLKRLFNLFNQGDDKNKLNKCVASYVPISVDPYYTQYAQYASNDVSLKTKEGMSSSCYPPLPAKKKNIDACNEMIRELEEWLTENSNTQKLKKFPTTLVVKNHQGLKTIIRYNYGNTPDTIETAL